MWGGVSELDLRYEVRHIMRFKDKHQRPLTDREKEIIEKVKAGVPGKKPNRLILTNFIPNDFQCKPFIYIDVIIA